MPTLRALLAAALFVTPGCNGTKTTASVPRNEVWTTCKVTSDGAITTLQLDVYPEVDPAHRVWLGVGGRPTAIPAFRHEVDGPPPHALGRANFATTVPAGESFSIGFEIGGEATWVEIPLPRAPTLSVTESTPPKLLWDATASPQQMLGVHAACTGVRDPKGVASFGLPDKGEAYLDTVLGNAEGSNAAIRQCEEITLVASRITRVSLAGLRLAPSATCTAEQIRSLELRRPAR